MHAIEAKGKSNYVIYRWTVETGIVGEYSMEGNRLPDCLYTAKESPPVARSSRPPSHPRISAMKRALPVVGLSLAMLFSGTHLASAETRNFEVTVQSGKLARSETPVSVVFEVPTALANAEVQLQDADGHGIAAQLTPLGLGDSSSPPASPTSATQPRELHFVLPILDAGATLTLKGSLAKPVDFAKPEGFSWNDVPKDHIRLWYRDRPVMDYMDAPLDDSTKESREKTFKVYHHLYDPEDGSRLVTKGPGGLYTHHRGLFYGFQRVSYGATKTKQVNIWECANAHQSHEGVLSSEAGSVLGRQLLAIDWHGPEKTSSAEEKLVFAHEQREITVYHVPGGTMVDAVSLLKVADLGPVRLDGDPQHAGFQFRAAQEVADKTKGQTIYIRPDGVGAPGETRNWDAKKRDPICVNLPWKGMSFVLGDQRYTAAILDRPDNPKEARYSERDYGRFGSYFEYNLTKEKPLLIHYRVWLQRGQATQKRIAAMADDFVDPVQATVQMK